MADGKWIPGLTSDTPPVEAARAVLDARLHVVRHYLPLAVEAPDADVEHVHQLRVGTRRAGAALAIFAACLSEKRGRALRKRVRKIRRAAGAARDWDVFQAMLALWSPKRPPTEQPGLDFLRGHAFAQRQAAQFGLRDVADSAPHDPDDALIAPHLPRRLADLALPMLNGTLSQLDGLMGQDLEDFEHLHQIRITGKQLRYAMEVFADCFAPSFRSDLYPAIEEMQEILGDANDSHVAVQRLTELRTALQSSRPDDWPRFKVGVERLLQHHRRRLPQQRRKFAHWRTRWRALLTPLSDQLHTGLAVPHEAEAT